MLEFEQKKLSVYFAVYVTVVIITVPALMGDLQTRANDIGLRLDVHELHWYAARRVIWGLPNILRYKILI